MLYCVCEREPQKVGGKNTLNYKAHFRRSKKNGN